MAPWCDWFLGSLFVAPAAQGSGIGSRLLDAVWGVDGDVRRRTLTDAIQPISNALYGRRGLLPATPLLSFSGSPIGAESTLTASTADDLVAIDEAAYGFDRSVDHRLWGEIAERTVWLRDGRPAAYPPASHRATPRRTDQAAAPPRSTGRLRVPTGRSASAPVATRARRRALRRPAPLADAGLLLCGRDAVPTASRSAATAY
jgi:hypothetical protein